MNPEVNWEPSGEIRALNPGDIESRIGMVREPVEVLSGGLANTNIRIGKDRVLRIYRRDPGALLKERALLLKPWQFLTVPQVLASGHDYLLLSFVEHQPLKGTVEEGEALGCALSEIHGTKYKKAGLLGADFGVMEPWDDLVGALGAHMADCLSKLEPKIYGELGAAMLTAYERNSARLRVESGEPLLLHADFKLSNLHATASGLPLVLDWEFAYSGSALSDLSQLFRWELPKEFVDGFEAAYQVRDLRKTPDWRALVALMDLPNLAGLLLNAKPGSIRDRDVSVLIKEIIQ